MKSKEMANIFISPSASELGIIYVCIRMYRLENLVANLLVADDAEAVDHQDVDQPAEDHQREEPEHAAAHGRLPLDAQRGRHPEEVELAEELDRRMFEPFHLRLYCILGALSAYFRLITIINEIYMSKPEYVSIK